MFRRLFLTLLLLSATAPALALNVVATSTSMGALVRAVAGERADLTVLVGPDQDLHYLEAKPTMIRALRSADLVVSVGAELEIGWLPLAIESAANRAIQPGQPGYFEAAAQVSLIDHGAPADRAQGDVHPLGNPHVNMDPVRMVAIAQALAERFALLDAANAAGYRRGAERFAEQVDQRLPQWQQQVAGAPGVVLYHRDANYLLERLDVPLLGTIEPIPGVPPSGRDLRDLRNALAGQRGIILFATFESPKAPQRLAEDLDWPFEAIPLDPQLGADGEGYLALIDRWVTAIRATR